jgi:hypothetical protein
MVRSRDRLPRRRIIFLFLVFCTYCQEVVFYRCGSLLEHQAFHGSISLDGGRIDGLRAARDHALLHAQAEDPVKQGFEQGLRIKLAGAGEGGVPGERLVELVAQEIKQVQP